MKLFANRTEPYGLFYIQEMFDHLELNELELFWEQYFGAASNIDTKDELQDALIEKLKKKHSANSSINSVYKDFNNYLGKELYNGIAKLNQFGIFDYAAKEDLISVFADYCADIGIYSYRMPKTNKYMLDLFLTKKPAGFVITEAVFILCGWEVEEKYDQHYLELIKSSETYTKWKVFVTTPAGVMKIGYQRLINDMKKTGAWTYIIHPTHKRVIGVIKGKSSHTLEESEQQKFYDVVTVQPYRAPSQVMKISKYKFSEKYAYEPKNIRLFVDNLSEFEKEVVKKTSEDFLIDAYSTHFKKLLVLSSLSGIPMFSSESEQGNVDDTLVSGFLTALDSFISQMSGKTTLEQIEYKGFVIYGHAEENTKFICIMDEKVDINFEQHLAYFGATFELQFKKEIEKFVKTGNMGIFNAALVTPLIRIILGI